MQNSSQHTITPSTLVKQAYDLWFALYAASIDERLRHNFDLAAKYHRAKDRAWKRYARRREWNKET
jgi:hypothetical protein